VVRALLRELLFEVFYVQREKNNKKESLKWTWKVDLTSLIPF